MTNQQLIERFSALLSMAKDSHDKCVQCDGDIMDLIEVFSAHNNLVMAFRDDCEAYIANSIAPHTPELIDILNTINSALWCGTIHLRERAGILRTNIIDEFLHQATMPRLFPN